MAPTPVPERQQYVSEFLRLLKASREELARIVTLENGKTIRESRAEVDSALVEGTYHLNQTSAFYGHTGPGAFRDITTWVQYQPLGVVGVISPWNFPMNVMCRKTLPALLTGNTVVFKPASFTPWSGVFMAGLFERAGLPKGVFNCVSGLGSSVGNRIVEDPRVRAISFTGSTEVGKKIQVKAAAHLTRTQLELGGKNALIVMEDADLGAALEAAVTAGFANAGQWCTSTSRILLQRSIAGTFLETLTARCEAMTVGDGLLETTAWGRSRGRSNTRTSVRQFAGPRRMVRGSIAGGDADVPADGYFIRPTVFAGVRPEMEIFREEIFGPVLAASEFESLDEALEMANNSIYGLSSAIYTSDLRAASTTSTASRPGWRTSMCTPATRSRRCRSAASSSRAPACLRTAKAGWKRSSIERRCTCAVRPAAPLSQSCPLRWLPRDSPAAFPRQAPCPIARRRASPPHC